MCLFDLLLTVRAKLDMARMVMEVVFDVENVDFLPKKVYIYIYI